MTPRFVLALSCPDQPGIIRAVAGHLADAGCNVVDSQQFADPLTERFFLRAEADPPAGLDLATLRGSFAAVGRHFGMDWALHDAADRPRVLILVSKAGHCLNDLLFRWESGALRAEVVGVVSNHPDLAPLAGRHGVPFHHVPVPPGGKPVAEKALLDLVAAERVDLVVLARYMQVLSDPVCAELAGRAINIHHSFLPSFAGARPYHQAYERGVKLIGATAHYVTAELDEGPIIEQDVHRVDHAAGPEALVAAGQDVEAQVLARAVRWHVEHRVMRNGARTVVFR
ncbi:MAG TPA: formyltetrahydrofolate deformylase [Mycobacteriales bacterium]|nr:formyltetrahydrofolate deformylase [Mycobacteriales bacterium]